MRLILAIAIATIASLGACRSRTAAPPTSAASQAVAVDPYQVVHTFALDGSEGSSVRGTLVEYGGRLYGLAGEQGPNQDTSAGRCNNSANWNLAPHVQGCPGDLFSIALDGTDFQVEHAFARLDASLKSPDGYHAYGSLALGPDGLMYGQTQGGGAPPAPAGRGYGIAFSFDPATRALVNLHDFCSSRGCADGASAMGVPAIAGQTVYFTSSGSSVVDAYSTTSHAIATYPLSGDAGTAPYGGAAVSADGAVHVATFAGGANGKGAYSTIEGGVLHTWGAFPTFTMPTNGTDNTPINVPLVLGDGTVITSREFGGVNGTGALYRLSHAGVVELASFDPIPLTATPRFSNARGGIANGRIVEGTDGLLYGTTTYGGAYGAGSIWCAARDGSWIRVLHSFAVGGPSYPYGGLMQASDGKLYGTTFVNGVIFSFDPRLVTTCQ